MSLEKLKNIVDNIISCSLYYTEYIIDIDIYKNILKDDFEIINDLITLLGEFSFLYTSVSHVQIKKIYELITSLTKHKDINFDQYDKYYITIISKLYEFICNDRKMIYKNNSFLFFDVLNNFDKYNININDTPNKMFRYIYDRASYINMRDDEWYYDSPETRYSNDEYFAIYKHIKNKPSEHTKEDEIEQTQIFNEKDKRYTKENILKHYHEHIKYKLKYILATK